MFVTIKDVLKTLRKTVPRTYPAISLFATGCATAGTQTAALAPPPAVHVDNEALVAGASDVAWDRLVQKLSRSFYVINNIDKASRLINVSFTSSAPQEYIDCGTTTRTYSRGNEHEEYRYQVAQASSFKVGEKRENAIVTYQINRNTELEGRANIYVAPKDSISTNVSVNVRYILTIKVSGTYQTESLIGVKGMTGLVPTQTWTVAFNTNQPNSTNIGTPGSPSNITCYSRGKLEGEIISFARPN